MFLLILSTIVASVIQPSGSLLSIPGRQLSALFPLHYITSRPVKGMQYNYAYWQYTLVRRRTGSASNSNTKNIKEFVTLHGQVYLSWFI